MKLMCHVLQVLLHRICTSVIIEIQFLFWPASRSRHLVEDVVDAVDLHLNSNLSAAVALHALVCVVAPVVHERHSLSATRVHLSVAVLHAAVALLARLDAVRRRNLSTGSYALLHDALLEVLLTHVHAGLHESRDHAHG